jgi:Zn-dependent M32 family carboxypeptidase
MQKCKKCQQQFEPQKGLLNYCSLKCRNSREWSEADKEKKRLSAKDSKKVKQFGLDNKANSPEAIAKRLATWQNKRHERNFSELSLECKRKVVFEEQNNSCACCGLREWLGQSITLELEHKDGNRFNHDRENLEALCPNCHSQTKTWRGRNNNKQNGVLASNVEQVVELYRRGVKASVIFRTFGLADKGNNYKVLYKILEKYNIPL